MRIEPVLLRHSKQFFDQKSGLYEWEEAVDRASLEDFLKVQDGCYVTRQYAQDDSYFYRVGFELRETPGNIAIKVFAVLPGASESSSIELKPIPSNGSVYVEVGKARKTPDKKHYFEDAPSIVTASGVYQVVARNETGDELSSSPLIYVLPSGVSKQSYLSMLNNLFALYGSLVSGSKSTLAVGEIDADSIIGINRASLGLVDQFLESVADIRTNPLSTLEKTYERTNAARIHLFDARVAASYVSTDGAGKVEGIVYRESYDIYENRVLKHELRKLLGFVTRRSSSEAELFEEAFDNRVVLDVDENSLYEDSQDKMKHKALRDDYQDLAERIDQELQDSWYEGIDDGALVDERRSTKIFSDVSRYRESFDLLDTLYEEHIELDYDIDTNCFGVANTSVVYEYWVFLGLVDYLVNNLGFRIIGGYARIAECFKDWLETHNKLEGADVKLEKEFDGGEKRLLVELRFNQQRAPERYCSNEESDAPKVLWHPETVPDGQTLITPDYQLIFTFEDGEGSRSPEFHVIMDAKYNSFDQDSLEEMVKTVAVAKYLYHYDCQDPERPVVGSFIIHPQGVICAGDGQGESKQNESIWLYGGEKDQHHIGDDVKIESSEWNKLQTELGNLDDQSDLPEWVRQIKNEGTGEFENRLPVSALVGTQPYRYGAIHVSPADKLDGFGLMMKLVFQYYRYYFRLREANDGGYREGRDSFIARSNSKGENRAVPSELVCWSCGSRLERSADKPIALVCPTCSRDGSVQEFVTYSYCSECGTAIVLNARNDYAYRTEAGKSICPKCGKG